MEAHQTYLLAMRQRLNPQQGRVSCTDSPINFISLVHYQVLLWAPVEAKTTKTLSVLKSGHVFHGILEALETVYQMFVSAGFAAIRAPSDLCFFLPEDLTGNRGLYSAKWEKRWVYSKHGGGDAFWPTMEMKERDQQ